MYQLNTQNSEPDLMTLSWVSENGSESYIVNLWLELFDKTELIKHYHTYYQLSVFLTFYSISSEYI